VYQPAEQAAPLHVALVAGAVESALTVNCAPADVRPEPFVAVTASGSAGSAAPAANVYAPALSDQPPPSAGSE
jgi:hypothetical protein